MNSLEKIQQKILSAKEERWLYQIKLLKKFNQAVLVLKYNIPNWPKESNEITNAFHFVHLDFIDFLVKLNIQFTLTKRKETILGPESFFVSPIDPSKLKKLAIDFEENYIIGRLLDIDVLALDEKPIERKTKRSCYICDDLAINCMRTSKHSPEEAREFFDRKITQYLENRANSRFLSI
ncbi:MAG: citrate lyase holo-[acyl-carrier protein] synthase [Asgard group archaeon]|nr:citrate lyase holo-[acyl-carrier protein] synthase [Asgard group archaeon]